LAKEKFVEETLCVCLEVTIDVRLLPFNNELTTRAATG
jgi:hypothetical protein